jgi:flagellar FliL protein
LSYSESVSEEKKEAAAPAGGGQPKGPLILALVNTLAVLGALGFFAYTQFIFKKPKFTESGERERIAQTAVATPVPKPVMGTVAFEPLTLNIKPSGNEENPRMHFLKLTFAVELQDMSISKTLEELKPVLLDKILALLGRKSFQELVTVQGRFVLRTEILDMTNALLSKELKRKDTLVTNVYFNEFVVQ